MYPADLAEGPARRELATSLRNACNGAADVVLDPISGPYAEPGLRALGWRGRYLMVRFTAGITRPPLNLVLLKEAAILGVVRCGSSIRCSGPLLRGGRQQRVSHLGQQPVAPDAMEAARQDLQQESTPAAGIDA